MLGEMLAADAPVGKHWVADRESGPNILRYGIEAQREHFVACIAAGEIYFCIGMSEPDSGSHRAGPRDQA